MRRPLVGETAGKDKSWADMTTGEKRAASVIGFDEAAWEEGRVPVLCTHDWDSLKGSTAGGDRARYGAQFCVPWRNSAYSSDGPSSPLQVYSRAVEC